MIHFENTTFDYEPYPLGLMRPTFDADVYTEMLANWPAVDMCRTLGSGQQLKHYLNESKTRKQYLEFVASKPVWREFHAYVKSRKFIDQLLALLRENNLDLGYPRPRRPFVKRTRTALGDMLKRHKWPEFPRDIYTRFEFSMLPHQAGAVVPHTDDPKKISTMVLYMAEEGEWDQAWGGGLEVVMPKDPALRFNHTNRKLPYEAMDILKTYDYGPNQAIIFIKTHNSWHQVSPIKGDGTGPLRRTLTINFETN